jgi:predicted Zn-dependent protease
MEVNTIALESLPQDQRLVGLQASLTSHKGQVLCRLGNPEEGVVWLKKSYKIRSRDVPFNPRESAFAADNTASGFATLNDFKEADVWYSRAQYHYQEWLEQQPASNGQLAPSLLRSRAEGMIFSGRPKEARELVMQALAQIELAKPFNWAAGT